MSRGKGGRPPGTPAPCGTYAGYQRHRKQRTATCEPCRTANREYMRSFRESRPDIVATEVVRQAARERAAWKLVAEHRERFRELYLAEMRGVQSDDDFRDCHAAVPRAGEVELIKVGTR